MNRINWRNVIMINSSWIEHKGDNPVSANVVIYFENDFSSKFDEIYRMICKIFIHIIMNSVVLEKIQKFCLILYKSISINFDVINSQLQ